MEKVYTYISAKISGDNFFPRVPCTLGSDVPAISWAQLIISWTAKVPVPISVASSASIQIQKCGASLSWHMIFAHWAKFDAFFSMVCTLKLSIIRPGLPFSYISSDTFAQVNLCQKLSFLKQLTHNMTRDCSLNSLKNTSSQHIVYKYCFECQNKNKTKTIFVKSRGLN